MQSHHPSQSVDILQSTDDIITCRAVITRTGNVLVGENAKIWPSIIAIASLFQIAASAGELLELLTHLHCTLPFAHH